MTRTTASRARTPTRRNAPQSPIRCRAHARRRLSCRTSTTELSVRRQRPIPRAFAPPRKPPRDRREGGSAVTAPPHRPLPNPSRNPPPAAHHVIDLGPEKELERVKGIEPSSSAWKAVALPLSYTRRSVHGRLAVAGRGLCGTVGFSHKTGATSTLVQPLLRTVAGGRSRAPQRFGAAPVGPAARLSSRGAFSGSQARDPTRRRPARARPRWRPARRPVRQLRRAPTRARQKGHGPPHAPYPGAHRSRAGVNGPSRIGRRRAAGSGRLPGKTRRVAGRGGPGPASRSRVRRK